jgi:hypothetical protein
MDNITYDISDSKNTTFSLNDTTPLPAAASTQNRKSDPEISAKSSVASTPAATSTTDKSDAESEAIKQSKEFENTVKSYVLKNKPCVAILTPCFASITYVDYMCCLIKTIEMFRYFNIQIVIEFCKNDSLVSRARNNLIAKAMTNSNVTHMVFIDNDIVWDPIEIIKLLLSDKPLVGGIYPLKQYKWDRITNPENLKALIEKKGKSQLKQIPDKNIIQFNLLDYNVNFLDTTIQVENNITKVKHIATGFMMIQREVIEKMMVAFPSTKYTDDVSFLTTSENKFAYALFDCGVEDDHYYSEDWMFCHRWSKMGGDIYVDVSINLTHIGIESYHGSFISTTL